MLTACIGIMLLGVAGAQNGAPLALQNAWLRLEIEPRTFSVRFLGYPGGRNFVDPVHLPASDLAAGGWLEPGGITTDVLPGTENDALLRRGPAHVVERRDDYVLLLGPEHPVLQWQIKKEYQLAPDAAEVHYKLTLLSSRKDERRAGVRITAQLPVGATLKVPRAAGALGLLRGDYPDLLALATGEGECFQIPMVRGHDSGPVLLTAPTATVKVASEAGCWSRRLAVDSGVASADAQHKFRMLAMLDGSSHTYQVALEACQTGINVGAPLVISETWALSPPDPDTVQD